MTAGRNKVADEVAWLIERLTSSGRVVYFCGNSWQHDSLVAVRFCRRQDAEAVNETFRGGASRVAAHMWCAAAAEPGAKGFVAEMRELRDELTDAGVTVDAAKLTAEDTCSTCNGKGFVLKPHGGGYECPDCSVRP